MKPAIWFVCGGLVGAMALLAQDGITDWAERFAGWTATRNLDAPIRNAVHVRQIVNVAAATGVQFTLYTVPASRRFAMQQAAVYCRFVNSFSSVDQLHVSTQVGGIVARYPIARTAINTANNEFLAGSLQLYADPETTVVINLGFSSVTNASCEITGTGYLAQLNP